jgi:hypothetical protein
MTVHEYTAGIDTAILCLLLAWCWMDRHNMYFGGK